jgi:hypothetical protein
MGRKFSHVRPEKPGVPGEYGVRYSEARGARDRIGRIAAYRLTPSRAPFGPRKRRRSSLRMRLRCANSMCVPKILSELMT